MIMTIIRDNKIVRNFSISEENKKIIEKFLLLPTEQHTYYGCTTIDDILKEEDIIIDFCESEEIETF